MHQSIQRCSHSEREAPFTLAFGQKQTTATLVSWRRRYTRAWRAWRKTRAKVKWGMSAHTVWQLGMGMTASEQTWTRRCAVSLACTVAGVALLHGARASAQCEVQRISLGLRTSGEFRARQYAMDGHLIAIGDWADDEACGVEDCPGFDTFCGSGTVYVYRSDGLRWLQEAKLLPADGDSGPRFGSVVAVDSGRIVAAASSAPGGGEVYVFQYDLRTSNWNLETRLAPGPIANNFGSTVDIDGNTIVVGESARAYVFTYDPAPGLWVEDTTLRPQEWSPNHPPDLSAVAISDDVILVGSHNAGAACEDGLCSSGAAFIFRLDPESGEWIEEAKLEPSDASEGDDFGDIVALEGDLAVIAAPMADDIRPGGEADTGAVYVFRYQPARGTWEQQAKLTASEALEDDQFGYSLSLNNDVIAAGSLIYGPTGTFVFRYDPVRSMWLEETKLSVPDDELLAAGVAVSGNLIVADASKRVEGQYIDRWDMLTYVFRIGSDDDTDGDGVLDSCDNCPEVSNADQLDCDGDGIGDACSADDDTDGDGVRDACDNCPADFNPEQADCDDDGLGDVCAIAQGLSDDANGNGVPDECDVRGTFVTESGALVPFDSESPQSFTILDPPPAVDDVRFMFTVRADLDAPYEQLIFKINDVSISALFCSGIPCNVNFAELIVPSNVYNGAVNEGDAVLTMAVTGSVLAECITFVDVTVEYQFECGFGEQAIPDCNGNAVGDACDIGNGASADCNGNGVPDECDIADGLSLDCNDNGIPDECEPDCNDNGVADGCDIADGLSLDCNNNGIPDECDIITFSAQSGELSPIGVGFPQTFIFDAPPEVTGDVVISFTASAELGRWHDWIQVGINNIDIGTVFEHDANYCPETHDTDQLILSPAAFKDIVGDADTVMISMTASETVDVDFCELSIITVAISDGTIGDANNNQIPDDCETPGDLDGDGVIGSFDLILLLGAWGRCAECGDCVADLDGDCSVGATDLLILLGNWG